jgi:glycosyltransferase involved in cell wall biosynthesis
VNEELAAADAPTVSVIVLCFNTGDLVVEALACLERQTFQDFETILVDDGSTDDSVRMIEAWHRASGRELQLLLNERNKGIPASLNRGIRHARGTFVTWLSDDLWDDDRLATTVECFASMPDDVAVLFGDAIVIDERGREVRSLSPATTIGVLDISELSDLLPRQGEVAIFPPDRVRSALIARCFVPAPSVMVRASLYREIGEYDESLAIEDLDYWFRTSVTHRFAYLRKPLVRYRQHPRGFSAGRSDRYLSSLVEVLERYQPQTRVAARRARRHVREEALRVASGLFQTGTFRQGVRTVRRYYLPNLDGSLACIKETVRLGGTAAASVFGRRGNNRAPRS